MTDRLQPGAGFLTTAGQSARRTLLQYLRTAQLLVMPIVLATLFLFIFRYIFGGAISTGTAFDYVDFLVPGFLVTTVFWTGMNVPAGVAEDAASGVYDRLRSLPISRVGVPAGRTLADAALMSSTLIATTALGFAVGFRTHAGVASVVAAFALVLLVIYTAAWVFIGLGLVAANAQAALVLSQLVFTPLLFVSSAFVPVESMPGWMEAFAANQPVTAMVNAVRSLMLGGTDAAGVGHSTGYWVMLSCVWCAGILAVFAIFAAARFSRTR
jgi:ABC-2 type transport system permease protein